MHPTLSALQLRLKPNLFGRKSPPLQHPSSAALPIPAKISDGITLRKSFPELKGSMFAGVRSYVGGDAHEPFCRRDIRLGPFEPALSHSVV